MAILMLVLRAEAGVSGPPSAQFYVATDGDDTWSGQLPVPSTRGDDGPFATLERARDAVRALKREANLLREGVRVAIRAGRYELPQPFELSARDSGTEDAPIIYHAHAHEEVRLMGGKELTGFRPVRDRSVLRRLDRQVRRHVVQTDLRAQGITDYGMMKGAGRWGDSDPGLELFFNDKPMTPARWPNEGYTTIAEAMGPTQAFVGGVPAPDTCVEGVFAYHGDRPQRWRHESDVMLHGSWLYDWAEQRHRVVSIDTRRRVIRLQPPYHQYGYRKGAEFYAYNLLCELDRPGEWYLDRGTGVLYFWPPSKPETGPAVVSLLPVVLKMKNVSHVVFRGIIFEGARGSGIEILDGGYCRIEDCTVRNVGGDGIVVRGGADHDVRDCVITQTGKGGVFLEGGDRQTLSPAGHSVSGCFIHATCRRDPSGQTGARLEGVGNRAVHNLFRDIPGAAVWFGGNDHSIEYNEICAVMTQANDGGAVAAGRDTTFRGNKIRYNYFHHIYGYKQGGTTAVYLDDMFGSAEVRGNIFHRVSRGVALNGGRDNVVANNMFIDCDTSVWVDARGLTDASQLAVITQRLARVPYDHEPWLSRYPELSRFLEDEPGAPRGNRIVQNICWRSRRWILFGEKAEPYVHVADNLVGENPRFRDESTLDFQLGPALAGIGFEQIPFGAIGPGRGSRQTARRRIDPVAAAGRINMKPRRSLRVDSLSAPGIDGVADAGEWIRIAESAELKDLQYRPCSALIGHDGESLFVAVTVPIRARDDLKTQPVWVWNDGVRLHVRDASGETPGPPVLIYGFPGGQHYAESEPETPDGMAIDVTTATRYAARIDSNQWVGEWAIPLKSMGITYRPGLKLDFNIVVRRVQTGDDKMCWVGSPRWPVRLSESGRLILK